MFSTDRSGDVGVRSTEQSAGTNIAGYERHENFEVRKNRKK